MLPTSRLILNGGLKLYGLRDKCANVDPMARFVAIIAVVLTGHAFA